MGSNVWVEPGTFITLLVAKVISTLDSSLMGLAHGTHIT